ncbi:MAG: ABC transporter permease, partial [Clostridia bacterium]
MIKEILSCTKGYKKTTILTPILVIFEVAFETLIPFLMALIVDNGMNPNITEAVFLGTTYGKAQYVTIIGLVMIGCAGLSLLFGGLAGRTVAIAGSGFAKNMRSKMLGKIENFSSSNIDKFSTAALITRCSTDINNTQMAFMQTIRVIVRSPLMLIMSTIMAFGVNSDIAIVFLVSIPVLTIAMGVLFKFAYPRFTIMLTKTDKMNSVVQENLRAIREVKAFVREEHEEDKFNFSAEEVKNAQKRAEKLMVLTNPISQFVMYGTILAIVFISGGKIIEGSMQAGSLTSLITYAT